VLEYLNQIQSRLPEGTRSAIGPDATGVGWIFQYALTDPGGTHDLSQLRTLQDWFLRLELQSVPGVAEVATIGGMVRQYQIVLDPLKLIAYRLTPDQVLQAVRRANQEVGGAVLELAEAEYMVRASGYLQAPADFQAIALRTTPEGVAVRLGDVAHIQLGPQMRRGIGELDGEGEAVGGVIIMRSGENALQTIEGVKRRLQALQAGLPAGVQIVPVYDRSELIHRAIDNLSTKLLEEFLVVALVCVIFLFHLRSAGVAIICLPLGILTALIVMRWQGVNANIMSLGGMAIAIGAMVDAAVVMIENAHKKLEHWGVQHPGSALTGEARWQVIGNAAAEVGPALFFSLLIITLSFIPVFTLEAQEGRLFAPLALTKTYAMAAAAGLAVTLVPVLMGYLIRGRIPPEHSNPLNRLLIRLYRPCLDVVLRFPRSTLVLALALWVGSLWPLQQLGTEFMPPLDEGDLLYMPSALPGLSPDKAAQLLQQTNRLIRTVPEVKRVYGKAGRADTATDPAPLVMFETIIQFHNRDRWRPGMTPDGLIRELDRAVQIPGLTNIWIPPIRNRLDMLATGIKSPVGIKVLGSDLATINRLTGQIEQIVKTVPGVTSALAERLTGGRYVDIDIDRDAIARFGLSLSEVQQWVRFAIGGQNIGETVEGLQRFPINLRYPKDYRDSPERLRTLPLMTATGQQFWLGDVATIRISDGPPMLRSENARLAGFVYVDLRDRDLGSAVREMQARVAAELTLPTGYAVAWSGQFEYLERARARLLWVVPLTLAIIYLLLYLTFRHAGEALLIMITLPLSLVGGIWLLYGLQHDLSVAGIVGFIALAGVAAEFGVIMLLYLKQAWQARIERQCTQREDLLAALREGAVLRVRPKAMTVCVILAGLMPIMWGTGTGSEVMQRIAAPMVGGMISAPLLSLFVIPALCLLLWQRQTGTGSSTPNGGSSS
jgi:Cu(I)/Ag(I) efflux system membrane protein CusA/SilA